MRIKRFSLLPDFSNWTPRNLVSNDGELGTGGGGSSSSGPSSSATSSSGGASGGASSSPTPSGPVPSVPSKSAAPTSQPAEGGLRDAGTPSEGAADTTFDFGDIFNAPPEPAVVPAPVPAPQVPAQAAPTPASPVLQTPPAAEAPAQPAQPATPSAAPAAQTPAAPSISLHEPARLAEALALPANRDAAVNHLAETMFKLSPEMLQGLEENIEGTIPKLLASVFVQAQQNMFAQLSKIVPAMLDHHTTSTKTRNENENAFFSAWPQLNTDQHRSTVARIASSYRTQNPSVPKEQMIREVGLIVTQLAGLPITNSGTPQNGQPQARPATNGSRPPQPSPFVPIGASPAVSSTPAEQNIWEATLGHTE